MKKALVVMLIAAGAGLGASLVSCRSGAAPGSEAAAGQRYYCPMHPHYASEEPGDCPICGMKLVLMEAAARPGASGAHAHGGESGAAVAGRAPIDLSPERRTALGVRTAPAARGTIVRSIRTVGKVAVDERRIHHVHTRFEGYVEHLEVNYTGREVREGEHLLSVYSPEIVATQQEYLLAYKAQKELGQSGIERAAKGGVDLLAAARQRLLNWGIAPRQIERLEETGVVSRTVELHSDVRGYVVEKMVSQGQRVMPTDTLFDVADLSSVWVIADLYESDLPLVRLGTPVLVTVPYLPGRTWKGPVSWISPTVDDKTRTVKVRVEVANEDGQLKPDMYADVQLRAELGEGVLVPDTAIVHTGERKLVFVEGAEGRLAPREVQVGVRSEHGTQILAGLEAGERVVTAANFLLDSESSLRAAVGAMTAAPPPAAGHAH
jgi:Cu(I)/Ag(I) efflux system membrane fusion protein